MKPLKLTIQAFGPFSGNEEIDFKKLGTNPLFLINGPTGAGKSTILDAICFALYGQTTGADRTPSQMRCDHAKFDVLTEVTLDFSLGYKNYRIKRIPMQERAKSRGDGTTTQQSEATLWEIDGTTNRLIVSSSVNDANTEIKTLIGLDVEQFRQVMVLPQGKFRELLLADSKDREKIFSQLFQTSIYKKIEEQLKSQASEIKKAVEQHQHQIKGILQSADLHNEETVALELKELIPQVEYSLTNKETANGHLKTKEKYLESAKQIDKQYVELSFKEKEILEKNVLFPEIEAKKSKLSDAIEAQKISHLFETQNNSNLTVNKLKERLERCLKQLELSKYNLSTNSKEFEKADINHKEIESLQKKKLVLEQYQKLLNNLNEANNNEKLSKNVASTSKAFWENDSKKAKQLKLALADNDKNSAELAELIKPLGTNQVLLEKMTQLVLKRKNLDKLVKALFKLKSKTETAQIGFDKAKTSYEVNAKKAKKVELSWHTGQAAILAKELGNGQPCPVCGSIEHPELAHSTENESLITKIDVDNARQLENECRLNLDGYKSTLESALNDEKVNTQLTNDIIAQLGESAEQSLADVKLTYEKIENKVNILLKKSILLNELNNTIVDMKREVEKYSHSLAELETLANTDNNKWIETKSAVQQLEKQIPERYRNKNVLVKEISGLSSNIIVLINNLDLTRKAKEQAQSSFDKEESNKKSLATQVQDSETEHKNAGYIWKKALEKSPFDNELVFNTSLLDDKTQQQIKITLVTFKTEIDTLSGAIKQLEKELKDKQRPELNKLEQDKEEAAISFKENDEQWRLLEERKNQLISVQKKLTKAHETNEALEKKYRTVGTLYEVSNGLTGNKVSLQRFVLSVLLDDVLILASQRLSLMSKGRYQLIRKEEKAKGNKASGLELEVDDAYTGKTRSVATLSGGESFLAALSLALGLSDVVQSYSGGIKLDTLFIDEGFGSLDPESLDLAIRALIDLQSSGRMIGIISHVSELKEQMGLRIDVKTGKSGSVISTITTDASKLVN